MPVVFGEIALSEVCTLLMQVPKWKIVSRLLSLKENFLVWVCHKNIDSNDKTSPSQIVSGISFFNNLSRNWVAKGQ